MIFARDRRSVYFGGFGILFLLTLIVSAINENYLVLVFPFAALLFYFGWIRPLDLFLLLICSLPFSTEFNFSSSLGTDLPDEPLMWLTSLLFISLLVFKWKEFKTTITSQPVFVILVLMLCWTCLSCFFSTDQYISFKYLLAKSWYLSVFVLGPVLVMGQTRDWARLAYVLILSMFLVTVIILYKHAGTGFTFASVNEAVSPFFRNHVNYGAMLVCMIPICWGLYISTKKKNEKWALALVMAVFLFALYFTYSRGAWLALLAGIVSYYLIRKRLMVISFITLIVIALSTIALLNNNDRYLQFAHNYKTTIFHKDFSEHLISTYKLKDLSTEERFYRWIAGIRMAGDNSLTGSGPNTFYPLYKSYAIPAYKTWVSNNPEHSTVHNYFLLTTIEQGLPGLFFLLLLAGLVLFYSERNYHRSANSNDKIIFMTVGVIFTMILTLNFLSDLIETDKIGSLFFLCIALIGLYSKKSSQNKIFRKD